MRENWALVSGSAKIARNYINEQTGLEAVKFAEDMVVRVYSDNLEDAHAEAIRLTVKKYKLRPQLKKPI